MKKVLSRLMVLVLFAAVAFWSTVGAQAGPMVKDLTETNLSSFSTSPFSLNTDRFKEAFQTIGSYLSANESIPDSTILIADDHGHFLHGIITDWTYYTYGTHKGIELYVFNPEDGSQFLTVEVWLPKDQQRNLEKKDSYASSFQQIESFLTSGLKYRLDLVFQDDVDIAWGKGYSFKLDDEGTSLSFAVNSARHPRVKVSETVKEDTSSAVVSASPSPSPEATASVSPSTTPTVTHKKKKHSKASVTATVVATETTTDNSR